MAASFLFCRKIAGQCFLLPCPAVLRVVRISRQVCRGRIYASRAVYPLYRIIGVIATGGLYAAPTNQPVIFIIRFDRGRGIPRPYRATYFYCPVGRGDPTPPGSFAITGNFRQVCRGRIYASRAVYPSNRIAGAAATGGIYAAPTD